jgi:hypothetical protein
MLRSLGKKAMRVGRATVFLVGLSVILAMVFGVASTALAGNGVGAVFNLGQKNTVNRLSQLVGAPTAGAMLRVDNDGTGTALDLKVGSPTVNPADKATPPMTVDSQAVVINLNADELDGQDSTAFSLAGHDHDLRYYTEVESDGLFVNETDHNKAAHDALDIDADTLDNLDSAELQRRVSGECPAGQSIRAIGADGTTLTCEPDDGGGKAPDSEMLDGIDSTGFQLANAPAGGDLTGRYPDPTIANDAVRGGLSGEIADNTLDQNDIAQNGVNSDEIVDTSVRGGLLGEIANGTVDQNDIAPNGVSGGLGGDLTDNSVDQNDIAQNGVNSDEIVDGAVKGGVTGEIDNNTITADDIAPRGVTMDEMAPLPAVKARNSNLPVNDATHTPLQLTTEDFDQVGAGPPTPFTELHDPNASVFRAPRAGIYEIQVEVIWGASSTAATGAGERRVTLRRGFTTCGDGTFDDMDVQFADPGDRLTNHVSTLMAMGPGETVILCGFQSSGEPLNISFVFASMHYVSAR